MQRQIAMLRASRAELDTALDGLAIDESFAEFVTFCESHAIPMSVLSDGVDYFIERILAGHQLNTLPIVANCLTMHDDGNYSLATPHRNASCTASSGVCKCAQIAKSSGTTIFVGDGRSDFCASGAADVVFAKGTLATYCEQQGIPYILYTSFADVQARLESLLPTLRRDPASIDAYNQPQLS
jgi:2,3-diketo-5-methylthio-1-phosphopentane phosphatase